MHNVGECYFSTLRGQYNVQHLLIYLTLDKDSLQLLQQQGEIQRKHQEKL